MSRVKSPRRQRHKKVMEAAKGFRQARSRRYKVAREAVLHAGQYAFAGRRKKKRDFRRLWIQRINAAVREEGMTYGTFMHALKEKNIALDRKILAQLAVENPESFSEILRQVKTAQPQNLTSNP